MSAVSAGVEPVWVPEPPRVSRVPGEWAPTFHPYLPAVWLGRPVVDLELPPWADAMASDTPPRPFTAPQGAEEAQNASCFIRHPQSASQGRTGRCAAIQPNPTRRSTT